MKKSILECNLLISIFIASFFIIFSTFLPVFDDTNSFHNLIFDSYKLVWYDGRSPANFYLTKNIIENGLISFPEGYTINDRDLKYDFDFVESNHRFYPRFSFYSNYVYAAILYFIPLLTDVLLFKGMILLNIIFSAIVLVIFYHIQKLLGLNAKYSFLSTLTAGVATSILIYSRYLFISQTLINLTFFGSIYFFMKNWKKKTIKTQILGILIFSTFIIFLEDLGLILAFFIIFLYYFWNYKLVQSTKALSIAILILILIIVYNYYSYTAIRPSDVVNYIPSSIKDVVTIQNIFKVFNKYINALDFSIYGYHDLSSIWKLDRTYAYVYAFEEPKGNAIFLRFYGLFGSLFGSKGFIYNSPYLIFSIAGIFLYKENKKKKLILLSIILIILTYGLLNSMWYGGVTPRYVRHFDVPILFLTFFSFYYIQEISKEKNKFKKYSIYLIFTILIILSILNVISIAIRTDWNYEHEANLVSYDLVIWPWYPPKSQGNIINLYLTEQGESVEWKYGGEIEICKSYASLEGIFTPTCGCNFITYAERNIDIPWEKVNVNITACSPNNDDIIGRFYFDQIEKEISIEHNSCKETTFKIENSNGNHKFVLKPKIYGNCTNEVVVWKLITIEKI